MNSWKTDPLYQRVFREIEVLRDRVRDRAHRLGIPPDGFRIEEHSGLGWDDSSHGPTILRVWILDDFGPRLFPGLRHYPHDPGEIRGDFWQFGLIRFSIAEDRSQVSLVLDVGPGCHRDLAFDVLDSDDVDGLNLREEMLSGSL